LVPRRVCGWACFGRWRRRAAPSPAWLIESGLPIEATVAHVLVARYADHLLLYRQAQILAPQGVLVDLVMLAAWVGIASAEIGPVAHRLNSILLGSPRLFADEPSVPVLDLGRRKTKTGWF